MSSCGFCSSRGPLRYSHKRIGTGGLGNKRTRGDHPNDSIIEIGQSTEKSPGDLRNLQKRKRKERKMLGSYRKDNNNNDNNNDGTCK